MFTRLSSSASSSTPDRRLPKLATSKNRFAKGSSPPQDDPGSPGRTRSKSPPPATPAHEPEAPASPGRTSPASPRRAAPTSPGRVAPSSPLSPRAALHASVQRLRMNKSARSSREILPRDLSYTVLLAGSRVVHTDKNVSVAAHTIAVVHPDQGRTEFTRTVAEAQGFRSALKKQARNAAMVVELPPVKSSADLVVFFSEVFQTPLRSLPLVAGLFAERGVSDAVPSEAVVRAFVDDVVSKLGLGLGSAMAVHVKKRFDVEFLVQQVCRPPPAPRGAAVVDWQTLLMERVTEVVLQERHKEKEAALRLIDDIIAETPHFSAADQAQLRAHPEFQALVAGFARNDNTADDLDESAKATGMLMRVMAQLIRTVKLRTEQEGPALSPRTVRERATQSLRLRLLADDLEYLELPEGADALHCAFCDQLVVEPLRAACGHLFCAPCVEAHKKQRVCPEDGSPFRDSLAPADASVCGALAALQVRCLSMTHGCGWVGPRGDVLRHAEAECEFKLVTCANCSTKVLPDAHDEQECEAAFVMRFQRSLGHRLRQRASQESLVAAEPPAQTEDWDQSHEDASGLDGGCDDEDMDSEGEFQVMSCPTCDASIVSVEGDFCLECGARLPRCQGCSTRLPLQAEYCFSCGRKQT